MNLFDKLIKLRYTYNKYMTLNHENHNAWLLCGYKFIYGVCLLLRALMNITKWMKKMMWIPAWF